MSSRSWFWAPALGLAVAASALAQPAADEAPSPLQLVQGLREGGMADLALEYLQEVEASLSPQDRALVPLERARCILDASESEPDEGTRASMIGEAKDGFNAFLLANAKHPRAAEASLALARLTSIEARAQLNRGRRVEVPASDDPGYDDAVKKQREELLKARPLFLLASKQFADAAGQLKERAKDPNLSPAARQAVAREVFDADLASAVNKYYLADTFLVTGSKDTLERDKYLEDARVPFAELAKGPPTSRNVWVARAWMAEILADQAKPTDAEREFAAILSSRLQEAEEGKRLVRFFQIRRKFFSAVAEPTQAKLQDSVGELRGWLARYGNARKPTPESLAARYYLALDLQLQAFILIGPPPKPPANPPALTQTQRRLLQEAEKLYRALGQSDNDYTARADRNRMVVVRKLLGEADRPASAYPDFEEAQMAALIQMAKLQDAERARDRAAAGQDDAAPFWLGTYQKAEVVRLGREIADRQHRVVALLEHAREVATEKDNPNDVTDNLLRLVYFYQQNDQPFQAAVLGEHIARTIKTTGGKAATAGVLALRGYARSAASRAPNLSGAAEAAAAMREVFPLFPEIGNDVVTDHEQRLVALRAAAQLTDRERAIEFARFLDEKFPNDTATDTARHQLASLLFEEKKPEEAFNILLKVRAGYPALATVRQFQAFLAGQLVAKDSPLAPERRREVFRRTAADLGKLARPGNTSAAADARGYLACRLRLAQLYLAQPRVDPEAEANPQTRGYKMAQQLADEVLGLIPTFENLNEKEKKGELTLDGLELRFQALDLRTRVLYLQARALVDEGKLADASAVIDPVVAEIAKGGLVYDAKMREWAGLTADPNDPNGEAVAKHKAEIARTAANVDKVRRDIVMVGFKLFAVQGKKGDAANLLELLKKVGGGVEANQGTLELMARELSVQITALRKAGKTNEAKALGDGLALLLKEFTNLKELSPATILFLGQTFYTVGQYDDALAQLAKVMVPVPPAALKVPSGTPWWQADPLKIEDGQTRKKFQDEIRDYRAAQLFTARALRGLGGSRLAEAEKLLREAIGDAKARGYANSSLDFRKELAYTHEAIAASTPDTKAANAEWVKAVREWTTLFQIAQERVRQIKPKTDDDPGTPEDEARRIKNDFFDAFFEPQRVVVAANAQLIKDPAKLEASYARVAKSLVDLETVNKFNDAVEVDTPRGKVKTLVGAELVLPEVAARYWELIDKNPALKGAYTKAGGRFFLARPKTGD